MRREVARGEVFSKLGENNAGQIYGWSFSCEEREGVGHPSYGFTDRTAWYPPLQQNLIPNKNAVRVNPGKKEEREKLEPGLPLLVRHSSNRIPIATPRIRFTSNYNPAWTWRAGAVVSFLFLSFSRARGS